MNEMTGKEFSIPSGSPEMSVSKKSGLFQTLLSALIYGFTPTICSVTYALGNNHTSMTFFRNLLILPAVILIIAGKKIDLRLSRIELLKILILANLGTLMTTLLLYSSYRFITVGMATTIHFMYPILVIVFCRIFYRETITKKKMLSIALAFMGIVFFLLANRSGSVSGILLAFSSGITFALYLMLLDKWGLSEINSFKFIFYTSGIAVTEMFLADVRQKFILFAQPAGVYALMFIVAMLASLIAAVCLKEGVRILGSTTASFISLLEPISSVAFGAILLKERVSFLEILGCISVILSILNLIKDGKELNKR